jgi:hypothetical protein
MASRKFKKTFSRIAQICIISAILFHIVLTEQIAETAWGIAYIFGVVSLGLIALLVLICASIFVQDLYKPQGYTSLKITNYGIEFQFRPSYEVERIAWEKIASITFDRFMSMDSEDESWTDWIIRVNDGRHITINGEPHSGRIMAISVARRLTGFRWALATRAMLSTRRASWICYESGKVNPNKATRNA